MTIAVGDLETSWRMGERVTGVHALLTLSEMVAYPEKTLHPKTLVVGAIYPDPVALWMILDIDDGNETLATGTVCAIVSEVKDELKSKVFDIHQWPFPDHSSTRATSWLNSIESGDDYVAPGFTPKLLIVHQILTHYRFKPFVCPYSP